MNRPQIIKLARYYQTIESTSGALFYRGQFLCFTLEPGTGGTHPCIPDGVYLLK